MDENHVQPSTEPNDDNQIPEEYKVLPHPPILLPVPEPVATEILDVRIEEEEDYQKRILLKPVWVQQPQEKLEHHQWFEIYRNLGRNRGLPRTIEKVKASSPDLHYNTVANCAKRWLWRMRAKAWDKAQNQEFEGFKDDKFLKLQRDLITFAEDCLTKASQALAAMDPKKMKTRDALELAREARDIMQIAVGKHGVIQASELEQHFKLTTLMLETREEKERLLGNKTIKDKVLMS